VVLPDNDIARHGRSDNAGRRRQGVARLIRSRRAQLAASAAVIGLALVPAMGVAVSYSLHVSGPTSNKIGTPFIEETPRHAKGAANFVVAREQYYRHSGRAATYAVERTRAFLPSTYRRTLWVDQSVHGNDSITAHYGAANLGTHGMCAYLIGLSSGNTYAHGGIFWANHTSASRPCNEALAPRGTAPPAT
jgi:hypothetical protein